MNLSPQQVKQLMAPLNAGRIAKRKQGSNGPQLSYLEAWDVKAHLTRIFGFGGWSAEVLDADLVFAELAEKPNKSGVHNWDVAYKVRLQLTVQDATYTEVAVGSAHLPDRGDAHDMAVKTAESDALKRAAINLGTQFGLSLYNNGSKDDVVMGLLDPVQKELLAQATDHAPVPVAPIRTGDPTPAPVTPTDDASAEAWVKAIDEATDMTTLVEIGAKVAKVKAMQLTWQGATVAKHLELAQVRVGRAGR